jgi:hypothetical protein
MTGVIYCTDPDLSASLIIFHLFLIVIPKVISVFTPPVQRKKM